MPISVTSIGLNSITVLCTYPPETATITRTRMQLNGNDVGDGPASNSFMYTFTGLSPNTTYTLTVIWYRDSNVYIGPNSTTATTGILPGGTTVTGSGNGPEPQTVSFSWTPAANATYYHVMSNTGTDTTTTNTFYSLGTKWQGVYIFTVTPMNQWGAGPSAQATVVVTAPVRPSNFSWTIPKNPNASAIITASEWNSFTSRINEFRTYKGMGTVSFIAASPSMYVFAAMFNQARNAINDMSPPVPVPATVAQGSRVYASQLNGLVASLNSIP